MLATEQRKLQDDDMKKVHERHRRLEIRKKTSIMTKEEKDLSLFKEVREREAKLVDQRYRNKVIQNVKSEGFNKSLDDWSRKGFTN